MLLHGVGANSMHWRFQFAGLSDRYRVIAWNAPGYMLSDAFKTDWPTCKDYADALADFLAAVKVDRVNVVGNSFGRRVAQCFAIHYPARVIKLAMTGTGIGPKGMPEEEKAKIVAAREATDRQWRLRLRRARECAARLKAPRRDPALVQRGAARHQPARLHARRQARPGRTATARRSRRQAQLPVLLISGSEDRVNPIDKNAAILVKALKQGKLEILEGFGHLPEVETPDTVNRMLRDFFAN